MKETHAPLCNHICNGGGFGGPLGDANLGAMHRTPPSG
jgi:hypothetical protein